MHHHLENDPVWNQHNKQLLLQSRCNYFITLQASSAAYLLSPVLSHMHPPATREMVASPISQHTGVRCDWLGAVFTTTSTSRLSPPPHPPSSKHTQPSSAALCSVSAPSGNRFRLGATFIGVRFCQDETRPI